MNIIEHVRELDARVSQLTSQVAEQEAVILALQQRLAVLEQQAQQS